MRDESVDLTGRYFFHLASGGTAESLQRLRHRSQLDELRGRRFSTLLYYFFYHPLVWWLNAEIRRWRESCCDEEVVARMKILSAKVTTHFKALKHVCALPI